MKYSRRIKESALRKILPPENHSVADVAREMGISDQTIYNWKRQAENGTLVLDDSSSPLDTGQLERYNLLLEARSLNHDEIGFWLREKGLHSEHLTLWEQEIKDTLSDKDNKIKLENQKLKKEKKELEKELRRKEKALAEMAALLTLKKKADALWGGRRGRMISLEEKQSSLELIKEAVASGARKSMACEALEISLRTCQRWENDCSQDRRKGASKDVFRKLSAEEQQEILDVSCSEQFKDLTPHEIVPILAEEGRYIASESSFYRVLKASELVNHRGNCKPQFSRAKPPELKATGPNQVWSWDITWLKSDVFGMFYYCYMIKDIWKKNIVGWEIHEYESVDIAADMFKRLKTKYKLKGVRLHSDNGNPMRGATMIITLHGLGVIPSFNRPRVSNDNPFIESLFSTMKYTAGYPGRFKSLQHSREWMSEFVNWYNTKHRHSAIGYVTPEQRGSGVDLEIFKKRNEVIETARKKHPERWVKKIRKWENVDVVLLNPDVKQDEKFKEVA